MATSRRKAIQPILRSTSEIWTLVQRLCTMFQQMSYTLEEFGSIVVSLLNKYYLTVFKRYKELVARNGGTGTKVSAQWSNDEAVHQILVDLFVVQKNDESKREERNEKAGEGKEKESVEKLLKKEAVEELRLKKDKTFEEEDIIFDKRTLEGLGNLYNSLQWLIQNLQSLKRVEPGGDVSPMPVSHAVEESPLRSTAASVANRSQFDTLLTSYSSLAQTTLFTLRLELRCHVIYSLDQTIREGNFALSEEDFEGEDTDPTIISLCKDLVSFEQLLSTTLPPAEYQFVLSGLAILIDQTFLALAGTITLLTPPGHQKLQSQITFLSQHLKHLVPRPCDALLTRAREYFSLFALGPAGFLKWVKETGGGGYDYDEMKTMLALLYSEQMERAKGSSGGGVGGQSGREKSLGVRRAYNECLIELNEALWS